jgi:hypothetical protein
MLLPPLLRAHGAMRTEAPSHLWEAETEEIDFLPLLSDMIAAALRPGTALSDLTFSAANVVVTPEPDAEASSPAAGDYVAITVSGPGAWATDWCWLPRKDPLPAAVPVPADRLIAAKVRYAYGRALGDASSVTVFLARLGPVSVPRAKG